MSETPPFGALVPSPAQERARRLARRLPYTYFGRKAASLLLGPAGGRSGRAFDVEVFAGARARLHPADNISEKRVYLTPQHWDPAEREALRADIAAHRGERYRFVDIGANAGLYTLFARCAALDAGKTFEALCIEADPEMRARLAFNLAASGAAGDARILPYAAGGADGTLRFAVNRQSRGLSRIDDAGALEVEARSLFRMLTDCGWTGAEALKIDIEGHEHAALAAFFEKASPAFWPRLVLCETAHEDPARSARKLLLDVGYREMTQTARNFVGVRPARS